MNIHPPPAFPTMHQQQQQQKLLVPASSQLPMQTINWTQEFGASADSLVSDLVRRVFCTDSIIRVREEIPFLEKFQEDPVFRWELIRSVLNGGDKGKLNAKMLAVICWTAPNRQQVDQLFARLIYAASDDNELTNLVSLAIAVLPQLSQQATHQSFGAPGMMSAAILHAVANARAIEAELAKCAEAIEGTGGLKTNLDGRVVMNVMTLIRWQQNATNDKSRALRHLGISLADLCGELQDALLCWALDYADAVHQCKHRPLLGVDNGRPLQVLDTFFNLIRLVMPQVQLPLRFHNRLLTKICALLVAILRLVDKSGWGTPADGVDYVCRAIFISGQIFTAQIGVSNTQLLAALLDEVFGSADELFNETGEPSSSYTGDGSRDAGASFNFNTFRALDFLNVDRTTEHSIFREIRQMPMEGRSAATVAHTGTLPRRKRHLPPGNTRSAVAEEAELRALVDRAETAHVRRLLFLNMLENMCAKSGGRGHGEVPYDTEMCRCLGQLLVDRFGGDGLTSHFCWLDWEGHERELSPQYLAVSRQLDQCPLVFDLLLLLADFGFYGLCFALPLFKAHFVTALVQLESSPLKNELISASHRERCSKLFALLISSRFFPELMGVCSEMLSHHITNHEVAVLMRDLWDFMQAVLPSSTHIQQGQITKPYPNTLNGNEGRQLTSTIVLIVQRHIAEMGALLKPLLELLECGGAASGDEAQAAEDGEAEEDIWAIDRCPKPIAIARTELKRQALNQPMGS